VPLTGGAASITGRTVWSGSTAPAEGVSIYLDKQLAAASDARTGPEGRFLLRDVKPGPHTVRLWASEDGQPVTRTVTVASGEAVELGDVTVEVRRTPPGTIGAGFSEDRGWVSVAWVKADGPAARAGVRAGDRLLAVDGRVVRSRQEAEQRTRGAPGSPVQLSLRREEGQEQQLQLTRTD
jgi:S1-C subfamily serine protease